MKKSQKFIINALTMTAVALLMRSVGVAFNVYVSNKIGAEAMGLYSLIGGVYGFAITFACSGINLGTMRLVSDALGKDDEALVRASMKRCLAYCLFFASIASVSLFFGAEAIGTRLLGDVRTVKSLRVLAVTLIPISLCSALNGYFTAVRRVYKNAATVILQEGIRIICTVYLLSFFLTNDIERACVCLVLGSAAAEISGALIAALLCKIDVYIHLKSKNKTDARGLSRKLISISLPVAFSAYARSGLLTLEHALIPIGLRKKGLDSKDALARYGRLHGMALPIVLFPAAIISSFAGLLVPEIAESRIRLEERRINYITEKALSLALLFALGVSGIMLAFSRELGNLIYKSDEVGKYIAMLAPLIPVMYIDSVTDALLKGLGEQLYCMKVNILDSALSVVLVFILIPLFGIEGYIITIYATELINAALSILRLLQKTGIRIKLFKRIFFPIFCIAISTRLSHFALSFFPGIMASGIFGVSLVIALSCVIYVLTLKIVAAVSSDDIRWFKTIMFS